MTSLLPWSYRPVLQSKDWKYVINSDVFGFEIINAQCDLFCCGWMATLFSGCARANKAVRFQKATACFDFRASPTKQCFPSNQNQNLSIIFKKQRINLCKFFILDFCCVTLDFKLSQALGIILRQVPSDDGLFNRRQSLFWILNEP